MGDHGKFRNYLKYVFIWKCTIKGIKFVFVSSHHPEEEQLLNLDQCVLAISKLDQAEDRVDSSSKPSVARVCLMPCLYNPFEAPCSQIWPQVASALTLSHSYSTQPQLPCQVLTAGKIIGHMKK